MARELLVSNATGTNVYAAVRVVKGGNIGLWFDAVAGTYGVFQAASWVNYAIAMAELGTTGLFEAAMPAGVDPERALEVYYFQRLGGAPAMTDTKIAGSLFEQTDGWTANAELNV